MQMLRHKLISRRKHDPDSIRNPSQWVASAVKESMREADKERFQRTDWGHNYLEQQWQWQQGGWHYRQ